MKKRYLSLLGRIKSTFRVMKKSSVRGIYERKKFIALIELERNRVHRDKQQFSLLLINCNGDDNGHADLTELIPKITKRMRRIDQIGWYDKTHLGVLLPNTPFAGAQVFINDIRKRQDDSNNAANFKILSYP